LPGGQIGELLHQVHGEYLHVALAARVPRRTRDELHEALAILDDLLAGAQMDPSRRIHQLHLTGDQIYADAVSPEQLRMLNRLGGRLVAGPSAAGDPQRVIELVDIELADATARFQWTCTACRRRAASKPRQVRVSSASTSNLLPR
jgi:hypothetical protein